MFVHREYSGAKEIRTPDPQNANLVLYQLSYNPDIMNRFTPIYGPVYPDIWA